MFTQEKRQLAQAIAANQCNIVSRRKSNRYTEKMPSLITMPALFHADQKDFCLAR
jgi:hypothetical protein